MGTTIKDFVAVKRLKQYDHVQQIWDNDQREYQNGYRHNIKKRKSKMYLNQKYDVKFTRRKCVKLFKTENLQLGKFHFMEKNRELLICCCCFRVKFYDWP